MNVLPPFSEPFAILQNGGGTGAGGVGTGFRLRERPAANPFTGGQLRNVLLALFVVAGEKDVVRAKRVVRGNNQRHTGIYARQFLDNDGILDVAKAGSA